MRKVIFSSSEINVDKMGLSFLKHKIAQNCLWIYVNPFLISIGDSGMLSVKVNKHYQKPILRFVNVSFVNDSKSNEIK